MGQIFKAYFIQCTTNMHVSSRYANYGIVDKLVQRDPVTNFPTIHASSLKGALREHFEHQAGWEKCSAKINAVFGREAFDGLDSERGECKFLDADLVSIPVRCNFQQYVLGINHSQIKRLNQKSKLLMEHEFFHPADENTKFFYKANEPDYTLFAEDIEIAQKVDYKQILNCKTELACFGDKFATFDDQAFQTISKDLPIIARNSKENSQNLWYEEIVPHQSIFLAFIALTETHRHEIEELLTKA